MTDRLTYGPDDKHDAFTPCRPCLIDLSPIADWPRSFRFSERPDDDIVRGDVASFDSIDEMILGLRCV